MKKSNYFQIAKVQSQDVSWLLFDFCQFQPGVPYKRVAYKKSVCIEMTRLLNPLSRDFRRQIVTLFFHFKS